MPIPWLREESVLIDDTSLVRDEILKKLVDHLLDCRFREPDKKDVYRALVDRERIGTTAMGQGIALPHCFSKLIRKPLVGFALSRGGVKYPSLDGRPVQFVFLSILPLQASSESLKRELLHEMRRLLTDRYVKDRLSVAEDAEEVCRILMLQPSNAPYLQVA